MPWTRLGWCGVSVDEHVAGYLDEAVEVLRLLDREQVEALVHQLRRLRERGGRLFFLGCGGGAAHASHAVNDARKLGGFEAYAASDNVSELTARVNDDGWETSYVEWLRGSRLDGRDMVFVFSVGGGDVERGISLNLVRSLEYASAAGATICGIVGRDGGVTASLAAACVIVPTVRLQRVTPHTEGLQSVLWHLLISHPALQTQAAKWESSV